jgi:hypothetical protein
VTASSDELEGLRRERDQAVAHARALEHEIGALRGKMLRMQMTSVWRRTWRRTARAVSYRATRLLDR